MSDRHKDIRVGGVAAARPAYRPEGDGSNPVPTLYFRTGEDGELRRLVSRFHYSHRTPESKICVGTFHIGGGLFGNCGPAVAACLFSVPPTRWAEPVAELSRLVRDENSRGVPLTQLIRLTAAAVRRKGEYDLCVSFADWTQNHHGGVYQAAGWNYGGKRDRRQDGLIVDETFTPGRTCNSVWGTRSPDRLRERLGPNHTIEPHYDDGKYLYWKALNKAGEERAARLGLEKLAYPKPGRAVA